jgi:hypothetical protein
LSQQFRELFQRDEQTTPESEQHQREADDLHDVFCWQEVADEQPQGGEQQRPAHTHTAVMTHSCTGMDGLPVTMPVR